MKTPFLVTNASTIRAGEASTTPITELILQGFDFGSSQRFQDFCKRPMPMPIPEFIMYGAYALRAVLGRDVAIAASGNGGILGVGVDARVGANDIASPVVNLLQHHQGLGGVYDVYVTGPPTEACLGMAEVRRARFLYEVPAARLRRRGFNGAPPRGLGALPGVLPQTPGNAIIGFAAMNPAQRGTAAAVMFNPVAAMTMAPPSHAIRAGIFNAVPRPRMMVGGAPQIGLPAAGFAGGSITPIRRRLFLTLAYALVAARHFAGNGDAGHAIGCVLVDNTGMILGCALNSVATNNTYHAETLCVMQYLAGAGFGGLPAGCNVFTTLQCCHMCAGVLVTAGLNVIAHYGQSDIAMNNNALFRGINGAAEHERAYVNFGHQLHSALGGWANTINAINSNTGVIFATEAIHQLRRLRYEVGGADVALWTQCQGIVNGIHANLV